MVSPDPRLADSTYLYLYALAHHKGGNITAAERVQGTAKAAISIPGNMISLSVSSLEEDLEGVSGKGCVGTGQTRKQVIGIS